MNKTKSIIAASMTLSIFFTGCGNVSVSDTNFESVTSIQETETTNTLPIETTVSEEDNITEERDGLYGESTIQTETSENTTDVLEETQTEEHPTDSDNSSAEDRISGGINTLNKYMLNKCGETEKSGVVSGYSAYSILTRILPYTSGETESQIQNLLGNITNEEFNERTSSYLAPDRPENEVKDNDIIFDNPYMPYYVLESSGLFLIDDNCKLNTKDTSDFVFKDLHTQNIVDYVNGYVNDKTYGLIPSLITNPFDESTMAAVIDTLYFKGQWENQFSHELTKEETFNGKTTESQIDMMHQTSNFNTYDNLIRLYYNSDNDAHIVMDIVKDIDSIDTAFDYYNNNEHYLSEEPSYKEVNLSLPKFEADVDLDLLDIYQSLGIIDLFSSDNCDLSKLADDIFVSKVLQKAKVIVDEDGTEAAAVTMMTMDTDCFIEEKEPPVEFRVDKPFMYVIKDLNTNDILFSGYVFDF